MMKISLKIFVFEHSSFCLKNLRVSAPFGVRINFFFYFVQKNCAKWCVGKKEKR